MNFTCCNFACVKVHVNEFKMKYLISISSKTAAFHCTGIEITSMVKFTERFVAVDVVENRWKSTSQS